MASSVKRKIRLGTVFLFVLLLLSSGVGIYHLVRLKNDSKEILKDNYESIEYCHRMISSLMLDNRNPGVPAQTMDSIISLQEANITEPGEREVTAALRSAFDRYSAGDSSEVVVRGMATALQRLLTLNMGAIERKNANATKTADDALTYITILTAVIFLVGFSFSYNFPSVVTTPINTLIGGIREIARKNYHYRIYLDRKDEFGQMADAFNDMAERLEFFESSNLNKIIFEKTRAEAVINSLKEASIGLDKDGIVLFANNQAMNLVGLTAPELVGKPVKEIAEKNDLLKFLLAESGTMPFKVVVGNHENYFTKEVLDVEQDGFNNKVIVLRNITSFKELDVAKTNLIATISHELKTPLASSDFSLKLLEDPRVSQLTDEQKELVDTLKKDNQRMLRILSELLNMSQVEAGKIQLEMTIVNAEALVSAALSAVSSASRERGVRITTQIDPDLQDMEADAEKTGWVLNNFLTNAIKYSSDGGLVALTVHQEKEGVQFTVTDNGPGIPAEFHSKVFDRFFKVPGSKTQGSGLGLAISKEFIEAQQGRIWFTSEVGSGSTFGFILPNHR
ncbi:MAG: HAMP domain-containing protein [Chitinophagaceae bacterium]|nr:MAG: HAMP domain-containing protein [Chitinophagaceae bacterium]